MGVLSTPRAEGAQEHMEQHKVKNSVSGLCFIVPRADSFSAQVMGPLGLTPKVGDIGISLFFVQKANGQTLSKDLLSSLELSLPPGSKIRISLL